MTKYRITYYERRAKSKKVKWITIHAKTAKIAYGKAKKRLGKKYVISRAYIP